jgi:hypothetical protein
VIAAGSLVVRFRRTGVWSAAAALAGVGTGALAAMALLVAVIAPSRGMDRVIEAAADTLRGPATGPAWRSCATGLYDLVARHS